MPKIENTPRAIHPFTFHGVNVEWREGEAQAIGDCPFCGKEGKLYIGLEDKGKSFSGGWDCKVCGASGNIISFLHKLWEEAEGMTSEKDYEELAHERKLLYPTTPKTWGARRSPITGDWLLPGFTNSGGLGNLYRYSMNLSLKKRLLLSTPGLHHQLFGVHLFDSKKKQVDLLEGPWDSMAWWETLRFCKREERGLSFTGSETSSLYQEVNVLGVPGCNTFPVTLQYLCSDSEVTLLYDSDHPREVKGKLVEGAGLSGMRSAVENFSKVDNPPKSVFYLHWGDSGFDPSLPSGTDVRDILGGGATISERVAKLGGLLDRIKPVPPDWVPGGNKKAGSVSLESLECRDWKTLTTAWRKSGIKWIQGLDYALSAIMASIASTDLPGEDQLWFQIQGPASCGKTTLCEAVAINKKYILPTDTMTGLLSGYQADGEGSENFSLVLKLNNKTLIIKDGDTILQDPARDRILSQFRAFYDRSIRAQYGNKMSASHEGINCTVILCGTSSLKALDSSELGERFLTLSILDRIDEDLEDEIGWLVINRVDRERHLIKGGEVDSHGDAKRRAKQLTSGYVDYIRKHAASGGLIHIGFSDEAKRRVTVLARFVAYLRARPSSRQEEKTEREMSFRLISQLGRFALNLALVLNYKEVNEDVMERVEKVALDTAEGTTLDMVKRLYENQVQGLSISALAILVNQTDDKMKTLLRFLRELGAVEPFQLQTVAGIRTPIRWRLTARMQRLYTEVMGTRLKGEKDASPTTGEA